MRKEETCLLIANKIISILSVVESISMSIIRGSVENCSIVQMDSGADMEKRSPAFFF